MSGQLTVFYAQGGELVRWMRPGGPTTTVTVPGVPSSVVGSSPSSSAAKLTWGPPAVTGGAAITGYVVTCTGATSVTTAATARSFSFGGLAAGSAHTLTVAAVNSAGTGAAVSKSVTVKTGVVTGERFPGDPNPMDNGGRLYWGMSSDDNTSWTTFAQFETQIGQKVGVHHYYDKGVGISSVAVPDATHPTRYGVVVSKALTDLAAGRLPLGSTHVPGSAWQAAGNGTFDATTGAWVPDPTGGAYDTQIQAFITWCEGSTSGTPNLSGPLWWVVNHEPDAGNGGAGDGNPVYYRSWMNRIRWNLDKWEHDNNKKRAKLVFLTCHTAFMWAKPAAVGSLGTGDWWPGDHVMDVVGVDCYAEHSSTVWSVTDSVVQSANFKKFHAFVTARNLTWALTEWGTLPANTNGHGVLKETYDYCTDGTQDCVLMSYFNSGWWHLTDDNSTLSEAKTEAKATTSIHLSDLGY